VPKLSVGSRRTGPKRQRRQGQLQDSLRLSTIGLHPKAAGDTASPVAGPELTTPVPDVALIRHRTTLINSKLPGLNRAPALQAGAEIVAALGGLVTEQRATRQDAVNRRVKEQTKTPDSYYGPSVLHLLRTCQAPDSVSLPPVCQAIAQGGRKKARLTMQMTLDEASEDLGCGNLKILLSPDVASKIDGLLLKSSHSDLGVGVNPCTFGDTNPESLQVNNCDVNTGSAAPSLSDLQSIIGKSKVTLARTFVELEASLKMLNIYLHAFYGAGHPITDN
jgi:hypothetical protein